MLPMRGSLAACLGLALCGVARGALNVSGAIAVFMVTDCGSCTSKGTAFCSQAGSDANFVQNSTNTITVANKKQILGDPTLGAKYCWAGTFGSLTSNKGFYSSIFYDTNITVSLDCDSAHLYYNQCGVPALYAIVMMALGSIVVVFSISMVLFCCGCCKCLNEKGDDSKYGLCNRFCPWFKICADKHLKQAEEDRRMSKMISEERSLTSKNEKLNAAYGKATSERDEVKSDAGSMFSNNNPLKGNKESSDSFTGSNPLNMRR